MSDLIERLRIALASRYTLERELHPDPGAREGGAHQWSPDGREIAYQNGGNWVVSADGTGAMRVTNPPPGKYDRFAFWSPDGLWLAFWSTRTGRMETWLVARERIGGSWSQPVQLTNFGCAFSAWVPDGSGTVAQAESDIWVMDLKR